MVDWTDPRTWSNEEDVGETIMNTHVRDNLLYLKAVQESLDYGMSFKGVITTYTDTTHFKVSTLAEMGTGFFKLAAGSAYEIYVLEADGAAPEGEQTPVVAYTTADGTFEHTAFTVPLAVGDIVLIIHPLIASLGTKATAAATGAVTTTDYLMAYVKQLVTQLLATEASQATHRTALGTHDTDIKNLLSTIVGYIDTEIAAIHADLGDVGDTATADDLSDIATTTALAKLRRLLLRFSSGAFSVSIDGSAKTDLDALYTALGVLLGTRDVAAASGAPTTTDSAMAYIKQLINDVRTTLFHTQGVTAYAVVTTATSATEFAASGLDISHHKDDYFNGWWIYVLGADQAAPLHEWQQISNFTQSGGVVTHGAFTVQLGVGDQVLMVHPMLYESTSISAALSTHDTDIKALLSTIAGYIDTEIAAITPAGPTNTQMETARDAVIAAIPAMVGTNSAALASVLGALADAAAEGAVTESDTVMAYIKQLVTLLIAQDVVLDNIHDTDLPAVKTVVDTIAGYLDTEVAAILAAVDTEVAAILVLAAAKVMGRLQIASTTEDLNQAAGTYDLFTGTDQAVVLEKLNVKMPTGAAGGAVTSIAIVTDDATAGTIISATDGAVANLTSEADLGWTGVLLINVGTKIRLTIAGGAHGSEYLATIVAQCRAVVSGGYLA